MYTFEYDTPEALGIPSAALRRFVARLEEIDFVHTLMLLRRGKVVLEGVRKPYTFDLPHQIFSVSKSFVSAAIGMAQREGRLKIADRLVDYFPEYAKTAHPRLAATRLADLLSMRSGFAACTVRRMLAAPDGDWVRAYFSLVPEYDPGTTFAYNSGATYMLSALLRRVTGENVREYLRPRLFEPLGIIPGVWECCPRGTDLGGWGLYLKPRDLAKFGELLRQGGVYDGRELIPQEYLAEATRPHADNSMNTKPDWKLGYGYQFWKSTYGYRCDGAAGQYAVVLPEFDLVLTTNSATPHMQRILTALWEEVVPHLAPGPLAAAPAELAELRAAVAAWEMPTAVSDAGAAPRRERRTFAFAENAAGITQCVLEAEPEECALTFNFADGRAEQLRAGFGKFAYGTLRLLDHAAHPTAASAAWQGDKLVIESFILDGIYRSTYTADLSPGAAEPVTRQDVCTTFRPAWEPLKVK